MVFPSRNTDKTKQLTVLVGKSNFLRGCFHADLNNGAHVAYNWIVLMRKISLGDGRQKKCNIENYGATENTKKCLFSGMGRCWFIFQVPATFIFQMLFFLDWKTISQIVSQKCPEAGIVLWRVFFFQSGICLDQWKKWWLYLFFGKRRL